MPSLRTAQRITALAVAVALAASVSVLPAGASSPWSGMGATLTDWAKAHPKNSTHCSQGSCYGGTVKDGGQFQDQFVGVLTIGKPPRVYAYDQAIGDGTPLAAAKQAVLALLPPDTKTTAFWIDHNDGQGNSCAFWNVNSKTLARLLTRFYNPTTGKSLGPPPKPGDVGIELDTVGPNGYVYKPDDVADANVSAGAIAKSATC
jgi:hypothetical protein